MATIGIDASRANAPQRTGAEWYAYHLIQALKRLAVPGIEWVLFSREPWRDGLGELPPHWRGRILPWKHLPFWTLCGLSWELWRRPVDLLFEPTHVLPLFRPRHAVATLHDVGFERRPEFYPPASTWYHRSLARRAVRRASRILTVSAFSRREIIDVYRLDPGRVLVTPNAIDPTVYHGSVPEAQQSAMREKYRLGEPFFLYVGRLEAKKNVVNILRAFSLFKSRRGATDRTALLLIGTPGFGFDRIEAAIGACGLGPELVMPGYVPEQDLPGLMAAARALVFPTGYEGFGLPILQAQGVGTPVITSDHSALPEVAGAGAVLVKADDPQAIADAMERLADDGPLRAALRASGFENVKRFSWEATARLTVAALLDVLGPQHPAAPGTTAARSHRS